MSVVTIFATTRLNQSKTDGSDKCWQDAAIIATAALVPLGKEKVWQIRKSQLEGKGRAYTRLQLPGLVCV